MPPRKEQTAEAAQLLTVEYFQKWSTQHAPTLQQAVEKRQRAAQEAEAERFAKARNAVISGIMRWMREGYTAAEAAWAASGAYSNIRGSECSYDDFLRVLSELGISWRECVPAARKAVTLEPGA